MDWKGGRRSRNVEDRRGSGRGVKTGGGIGIVGILIVLGGWILGVNPTTMLGIVQTTSSVTNNIGSRSTEIDDEQHDFAEVLLGSNEDVWQAQFRQLGADFTPARFVLFSSSTQSRCGAASAATGPFYCPADSSIYVDFNFIQEMQRLGATDSRQVTGNFAMAYVIAHEYGHHVSNLIGSLSQVHKAMSNARSKAESNQYSVLLELQADCFAGVWANNLAKYNISITRADLEDGLQAAHAVGDDHIMKSSGRSVSHENFTHGSSEQRKQWFATGLRSGDMRSCDTFSG